MALDPYDVTKHHVGLGPAGAGSISGFEIMGAYSKIMQRESLGAQAYGGSTDLVGMLPSLSRWSQDDFTGGAFQEDVSKDVAMFSSCSCFTSEPQSRSLISVPPLVKAGGFDVSTLPYAPPNGRPKGMLRVKSHIYAWFDNGIYHYDILNHTPRSDVYLLSVDATGGHFNLWWNGNVTANIAYAGITAASIQTKLEALPGVGVGGVSVIAFGGGWGGFLGTFFKIIFTGALANTSNPLIYADDSALTGGTHTVSLAHLQVGGPGYVWWQAPGVLGSPGAFDIVDVQYEPNEDRLYILATSDVVQAAVPASPQIWRTKLDLSATTYSYLQLGPAGTTTDFATGFQLGESSVLMAVGTRLFSGVIPQHIDTVSGMIAWTEIGRLPGKWITSCNYSGRTYILCGDNKKSTSLVAFDGSSIQPICTFPWNFDGTCMTEYAGRIYVGGHGTTITGADDTAHLYEVTGASVRLVRDFVTAQERGHAVPSRINDLLVMGGLLWMNCKGVGLISYDVTSDALFGGSSYQHGADFDVYALVSGYGRLWAWGHSDASYAAQDGLYRIGGPGDVVASYGATLTTSDFSTEIAVKKRLSVFRVLTRYVSCTAEISVDGGSTWAALPASGAPQVMGINHLCAFDLSGIDPVEHFRFRITLPLGTDAGTIGELVSYTCSFAFLDSGKKAWSFTVNGSEAVEGRDGDSVPQDVAAIASTLWGWSDGKQRLTFTDLDGTAYAVQLTGITETQPVIGPNIPGAGRPEAFYAVTLMEV